ncbi:MAG: RNA recognition motif domain-containing protein [Bacteroidota bacterium]
MNIYVGNLDFKVNEDELQRIFEEYGTVNSTKIIVDKFNGRSKGFGFIEMDDESEANEAIKDLNGSVIKDREIVVNEARPRKERY